MAIRRAALLTVGLMSVFALTLADACAATDTDTFEVTATVVASCNVTASDLAFGAYDPIAPSPLDAATTLDIICTNGTSFTVALNEGAGSGASVAVRKMSDGSETLNYTLYQDAARTNVWGESTGVDTLAGIGTGIVQTIDIYGRVPPLQAAPAGGYSDTVTVTVTY